MTAHNYLRYPYAPTRDERHLLDAGGHTIVVRVSGSLITTTIDTIRAAGIADAGLMLVPPYVVADLLVSGALVPARAP